MGMRARDLFTMLTLACGCSLAANEVPRPIVSVSGDTLRYVELPAAVRATRLQKLASARRAFENAPTNADSIIWYGRRMAYVGKYWEAIDIYTLGIKAHPRDARMYRHRGHRFITTRQFEKATKDLHHAATLIKGVPDEIEPDGLPNARNIPTSTLQSNIWYHLGLAHYLMGNFDQALDAYLECMKVSRSTDMLVATSHWLYMTLRRLEMDDKAAQVLEPIHAGMDVIENSDYYRLLLFYKGELDETSLSADDALGQATVGYGVGNWHYYSGRLQQARLLLDRVLEGPQWAAFGYVAAEVDMHRGLSGVTGGNTTVKITLARAPDSADESIIVKVTNHGDREIFFATLCDVTIEGQQNDVWETVFAPDCSRVRVRPTRLGPGELYTGSFPFERVGRIDFSTYKALRIKLRYQFNDDSGYHYALTDTFAIAD